MGTGTFFGGRRRAQNASRCDWCLFGGEGGRKGSRCPQNLRGRGGSPPSPPSKIKSSLGSEGSRGGRRGAQFLEAAAAQLGCAGLSFVLLFLTRIRCGWENRAPPH